MAQSTADEPDAVDRILHEWSVERPGTDTSAMAVFGRLHRCFLRYQQQISRIIEQHGINMAAFDVLTSLRRAGAPYRRTAGDLATAGLLSTGGVSLRADRLEQAGLVVRERDTQDRRIVHLRLSEAGLALIDQVVDVHFQNEREMLTGLTKVERDQLARLLGRLEISLEHSGESS